MPDVYANSLEISGKAVDAKTIAAFPDTCFTPPQTPATPPGVPIPYPSFGMASDTENGTKNVKIGGKEVNLKNKSDEKKTSGTEAGSAPKKGIITSKNTGQKYFHSWSPDVKFEGEPVIRFTDLASHNHASPGGNSPPWVEVCKAGMFPADFADEWPKCPCCDEAAHANQVDENGELYETIPEDEFYDNIVANRQAKIDSIATDIANNAPYTQDAARLASVRQQCQAQLDKATDAKSKIDAARTKTPPCPNLYDPPDEKCGTHFKMTRSLSSIVPDTVTKKKKDYYRKNILSFTNGVRNAVIDKHTKPDGSPIRKKGEQVNHKTPLQAGGCPVDDKNLMPNSALSPECQELDQAQTDLHDFGERDWG